ncbi:RDD family protein [Sulfurovum sp.]|uniref:RDD family protein n=1 Tax=Sulfurovum sp. TaxID=1969726 RepID=UPI002867F9FC|nr:RDD family protein [Sulfurovum sp.]
MEQKTKEMIYAGFFTRLLATLVDIFIVSLILSIIRFAIDVKSIVILVVVWWLYTTVMLIKWRTTIGGKLFGIEVLDSEQDPLSFKSASLRFIVSITPFLLYILFRGMQYDMTLAPSPTVQQLPQLLFFLPPLLMFFTQKKQMIHDLLVHSIVVDTSEIKRAGKEGKKSVGYVGQKILRISGTLAFLTLIGYLILYVSVFYKLGKQSYDANNASYEQKYAVNDYNDSKIIFYSQELERSSQQFVMAEGMYNIFEADVKRDLSLNCIQYFLTQEHNETDWIDMGSGFRKNARNKYANTKERIKKAKKNESYMGRHFYDYDLNDVNHIIDDIADIWKQDANVDTCQKMLPIDNMYTMFIVRYIENREKTLSSYKWEYKHAKPTGTLNKAFYKKEIEQASSWLETLYAMNPGYKKYVQKKDEEFMKRRAKYRNEMEKQRNLWESAQTGVFYKLGYFDGVDANMKNDNGETPLIVAVKYGHYDVVDSMKGSIVDVYLKDQNGKTAFDYIKQPYYKHEKIIIDKTYKSLRILEVAQIIKGKGRILQYEYTNDIDVLKIVMADANCSDFTFPENTQCKTGH